MSRKFFSLNETQGFLLSVGDASSSGAFPSTVLSPLRVIFFFFVFAVCRKTTREMFQRNCFEMLTHMCPLFKPFILKEIQSKLRTNKQDDLFRKVKSLLNEICPFVRQRLQEAFLMKTNGDLKLILSSLH